MTFKKRASALRGGHVLSNSGYDCDVSAHIYQYNFAPESTLVYRKR